MGALQVQQAIREHADPQKAAFFPRYFKTGPGQYAEGDKFVGVTVPEQRMIAKEFYGKVNLYDMLELLQSEWHEDRLVALFLMVLQFQKGDSETKLQVYEAYLANTKYVNNWDLVDSSAPYIVGAWLLDKDRSTLHELVVSKVLWERRIAIVATLWFIRKDALGETIVLAEKLLDDREDLMHKAVGWALRELGKKAPELLTDFLDKHAAHMPRTALRYSLERLPEATRKHYMTLS